MRFAFAILAAAAYCSAQCTDAPADGTVRASSCATFERVPIACSPTGTRLCTDDRSNSECRSTTVTGSNTLSYNCLCKDGYVFTKKEVAGTVAGTVRYDWWCTPPAPNCFNDMNYAQTNKAECCQIPEFRTRYSSVCADVNGGTVTVPPQGPATELPSPDNCYKYTVGSSVAVASCAAGLQCLVFPTANGERYAKCGCPAGYTLRENQDGSKFCEQPTCPDNEVFVASTNKCECREGYYRESGVCTQRPVVTGCDAVLDGLYWNTFAEMCRCRGQTCQVNNGQAQCVESATAGSDPNSNTFAPCNDFQTTVWKDCQQSCECKPGYTGDRCQYRLCDAECGQRLIGGVCVADESGANALCRCPPGQTPDNITAGVVPVCKPDSLCTEARKLECANRNARCENGACVCNPGYVRDRSTATSDFNDFKCVPESNGCATPCVGNEQCVTTATGESKCVCPATFSAYNDCRKPVCDEYCRGENRYCVGAKNDVTGDLATFNTDAGDRTDAFETEAYCQCRPGFAGPNCDPVDECDSTRPCTRTGETCQSKRCVCPVDHVSESNGVRTCSDKPVGDRPVVLDCRERRFLAVKKNTGVYVTADEFDAFITMWFGLDEDQLTCIDGENVKERPTIVCRLCSKEDPACSQTTDGCTEPAVDTDDLFTEVSNDPSVKRMVGEPYEEASSEDESKSGAALNVVSVAVVAAAVAALF